MTRTRRRRANGEGMRWRETSTGMYRWRWQYTNPLTGKCETKNLSARTQGELEEKITSFRQELSRNAGSYDDMTLSAWLEQWLATKKITKKSKTYENYSGICRNHIIPAMGEYLIRRIRKEHVQQMFNAIAGKGYTPQTVASVKRILRAAMNDAMDAGVIDHNPVLRTETPKIARKAPVALEDSDMLRLFNLAWTGEFLPRGNGATSDYLRSGYFVALALSMATGLRKGELFGLTWDRVNGASILVDRAVEFVKGGPVMSSTKTDSSVRRVAVPEAVTLLLDRWRKAQRYYARLLGEHFHNELGLVFTNSAGGFVSATNLQKRWWNPLRTAAGMPHMKWHNLRSASLSYFAAHGADMKTVSRMAGHSDIRTTMAYYIGLTGAQEQQRMAIADDWARQFLPPQFIPKK